VGRSARLRAAADFVWERDVSEPLPTTDEQAALIGRYGHLSGEALLRPMIEREFRGRIALVSSFGAEAAVLLHMVASIDRGVPVLFIDTGKLFGETLRYRDALAARLGLADVRTLRPDPAHVARADGDGMLWHRDADGCCGLRKVAPLGAALHGFAAWISGRKRFHGGLRAGLPAVECLDGRLKLNPLATWTAPEIDAAFAARGLPPHPLAAEGYASVGCMPCTAPAAAGADRRAGRWAGSAKTECGIHLALRPRRPSGDAAAVPS
jgi:phosphoadenosine phosphosulfate reductase